MAARGAQPSMTDAFASLLLEFLDASPDSTGSNLSNLRFRTGPQIFWQKRH
jgi:hypothetical protein